MPGPGIAIVGCGYVGTALGRRLSRDAAVAAAFDHVVGTTRGTDRQAEISAAGITPRRADLEDPAALHAAIVDCRVLYLTVAAGRGQEYRDLYVGGVNAVLGACDDSNIEKIVYTSSSGVYAQDDGAWVDETSTCEPRTDTGIALLEAENLLLAGAAQRGLHATVVRLTGIYGPDRGPQRRIAALAGSERSDGEAYLNLVHVDDIVEALRRLLDARHSGVLCLNDDEPTSRRAYYDHHIAQAGLASIRWLDPSGPPSLGKRVRNRRIKELLDLRLRHPRHLV